METLAISFCHLLNDMMQALLPAMYPMLKAGFHLNFGQVGLITFTFQLTASLLQPAIGLYTDHHPKPYIREKLEVGETGYFTANIKSPAEVKMGDTITDSGCCYRVFKRECIENLKFFKGMHRFMPTLIKIEITKTTIRFLRIASNHSSCGMATA